MLYKVTGVAATRDGRVTRIINRPAEGPALNPQPSDFDWVLAINEVWSEGPEFVELTIDMMLREMGAKPLPGLEE